jgi:hypothetical protein
MRERTCSAVLDQTSVINDCLELYCRQRTLPGGEIRLSANVSWIDARIIGLFDFSAQLNRDCRLQELDSSLGSFSIDSQLSSNRGQPDRLRRGSSGPMEAAKGVHRLQQLTTSSKNN